jgi:hypothetical protein
MGVGVLSPDFREVTGRSVQLMCDIIENLFLYFKNVLKKYNFFLN